jgi:hypothetical protein
MTDTPFSTLRFADLTNSDEDYGCKRCGLDRVKSRRIFGFVYSELHLPLSSTWGLPLCECCWLVFRDSEHFRTGTMFFEGNIREFEKHLLVQRTLSQ